MKKNNYRVANGTFYHEDTEWPIIELLENARRSGKRIRMFYGDTKTGQDWFEEYDVCGRLGRSMGPIKIPILLSNSKSTGGGSILAHCIIRLLIEGKEVYRHKKYKTPDIKLLETDMPEQYTTNAEIYGKTHARFKSFKSAYRWEQFMLGNRMGK